jgi:hypothetical protein
MPHGKKHVKSDRAFENRISISLKYKNLTLKKSPFPTKCI